MKRQSFTKVCYINGDNERFQGLYTYPHIAVFGIEGKETDSAYTYLLIHLRLRHHIPEDDLR